MADATAAWNEYTSPTATIQHTETRVFVGGPLEFVKEAAAREGQATPTTASSTLALNFDATLPRQIMTLANATSFLNKGAVCVGGRDWFSYSSKDGNELQIEERLSGGPARGMGTGEPVTQWFEITTLIHSHKEHGSRQGNQAYWTLELKGSNWNAQLIPQNATILVQERQWDNGKGPLPPIDSDFTSWRDVCIMYADTPVATREPNGLLLWTVTAQGRNKYLRAQKVLAGRYGAKVLTGTHTQSSELKNILLEPDEGTWGGNDFSASKAGDNNRLTVAITSEIPTHNVRANRPDGGNFYRFKEGIKQYGYKIQQLHINGRQTARYTRQQLNWIEFWSPYDPTDCDVPPCNVGNANYWILENDKGHRVYLGAQHGWITPKITLKGYASFVACYNEKALRDGWKMPTDATVWPWQECDGYIPEWDDGNFSLAGRLMHGAGQVFDLNPKGGWLALRRRPSVRDSAFPMMDIHDAGNPNGGYFAEPVEDFIAWGDSNLMGPHPTLGTGIPAYFPTMQISPGSGVATPEAPTATDPGDYAYGETIVQDRAFWGAYDQITGGFSQTPKVSVTVPIRPDGIASIPVGSGLIRKNCQAGGIGWPREVDGTPILAPPSDPTRRYDSNSPDDWEIVGNPVPGNTDSIVQPVWHKIELGTFTPPVVVSDDVDAATITLDDASNFPVPIPGFPQYVIADQAGVTSSGATGSIIFSFTERDDTTLKGVANRTPALDSPSPGDNVLVAGTALTLLIDLANPDTSLNQRQPANLHQLTGIWLRRYSRRISQPSAIKDFTIRISRLPEPNDPLTYLGRDAWDGNPDWETICSFHDNDQTDLFIPIDLKFARWIILICHGMSDDGRFKLNEMVPIGVPGHMSLDNAGDWQGLPTYGTGSIGRHLLLAADYPAELVRIGGGVAVRSVDVSDGNPWQANGELAEKSGAFVYEDLMNVISWRHDPSMPGLEPQTPRIVLTPEVIRGKVTYRARPLFQAGQIELTGRDDRDQMEWKVVYPAEVDNQLGGVRKIDGRFVTSKEHALLLAEYEYRLANGGTEFECNIGSYGEVDIGDIARIESVIVDTSGQEVLARDYVIDDIVKETVGGKGKKVAIRIRERVIW